MRAKPPEAEPEAVRAGALRPQRSTVQLRLAGCGEQETSSERRVKERVEAPVLGSGACGSWMLWKAGRWGERRYS